MHQQQQEVLSWDFLFVSFRLPEVLLRVSVRKRVPLISERRRRLRPPLREGAVSPSLVPIFSLFSTCLCQCSLIVCDFPLLLRITADTKTQPALKRQKKGLKKEKGDGRMCLIRASFLRLEPAIVLPPDV